ncbi:hypothetical protein DAI22_07g183500 [Oryza sativa Japonica Group]|nr:hypothetical protein DAI22_07g183500 [Oryza sativa Japonica Group]
MSVPEEASGTQLHSPPLPFPTLWHTAHDSPMAATPTAALAPVTSGVTLRRGRACLHSSTFSLPDPSPCRRAV